MVLGLTEADIADLQLQLSTAELLNDVLADLVREVYHTTTDYDVQEFVEELFIAYGLPL